MNGLIIKKPWIDLIVDGKKLIEVRGHKTGKVGERIALLESGTQKVRGYCDIIDCIELNNLNWITLRNYHFVEDTWKELLQTYKHPYAWELGNITKETNDVYYDHPSGAVIWVKNIEEKIKPI